MSSTSPWAETSFQLKAARRAAGFRTAAEAAAHFEWPLSTYRAHEGGSRTPVRLELERYARCYGTTVAQLSDPKVDQARNNLAVAKDASTAPRIAAGLRLRAARVISGFGSARNAAKALHLSPATYIKHEAGQNAYVRPEQLELYSRAFGVNPDWLASGRVPSGLGREIDTQLARFVAKPELFIGSRLGPPEMPIAAVPTVGKTGRPPKKIHRIPEYRLDEIIRAADRWRSIAPSGVIELPAVAGSARSRWVASIIIDTPVEDFPAGSRIFIDQATELRDGDRVLILVAMDNGLLSKVIGSSEYRTWLKHQKPAELIGRIIGSLSALHDR